MARIYAHGWADSRSEVARQTEPATPKPRVGISFFDSGAGTYVSKTLTAKKARKLAWCLQDAADAIVAGHDYVPQQKKGT